MYNLDDMQEAMNRMKRKRWNLWMQLEELETDLKKEYDEITKYQMLSGEILTIADYYTKEFLEKCTGKFINTLDNWIEIEADPRDPRKTVYANLIKKDDQYRIIRFEYEERRYL